MVRLDMGEYSEPHSVARLVGAPPGYIGHDEGGQLTEAVRRRPFQIVLLDEIEKAHKQVMTTLLGMLDDGRLTDTKGRVVDFANVLVIATSNLGAQYLLRDAEERVAERAAKRARTEGKAGGYGTTATEGTSSDVDMDAATEFGAAASASLRPETVAKVMTAVKAHFAPEFLNRIDEIVLFKPLSTTNLRDIVRHQVRDMVRRLDDRDIDVVVSDAALDQILRDAYNPSFGARPMRRYIEKHLATGISRLLLSGALADHSLVTVTPGTVTAAASAAAGSGGGSSLAGMGGGLGVPEGSFTFAVARKVA